MMHPLYLGLLVPLSVLGLLALTAFPRLRRAWLLLVSAVFLLCVQPQTWWLTLLLAILAWVAPRLGMKGAAAYAVLAVGTLFAVKATGRAWPVGLSFVAIQGVAYAVDAARDVSDRGSLPDALAYLLFFPKLSAGPIARFAPFREALHAARVNWDGLEKGLIRLAVGLGKKLLIADSLYPLATAAFSGAAHPLAWGASLLCCPLYVYFDFAGCTDAALGVAQMLGVTLPENFNRPFHALSLRDFWRRWHMSLSGFFRDYVYIPLGGSRCAAWRKLRNVAVVFLLMGVWHGFTWGYLLFGTWHALLMVLEHGGVLRPEKWRPWLARFYTLVAVSVGFVIFMATGVPGFSLTHEALRQAVMAITPTGLIAFAFATAVLICEGHAGRLPAWLMRPVALALLVLAWMQLLSGGYMPMLYAQF
ncbi:MAG: MBOAT family protein [Clostridia bacterium]|nr:MBOAT family protein [Clostridia bacterium]